jgi:two-component system, NarL family, nitrate/nitrite response regulator NarL
VRVILADDHPVVLSGLKGLLSLCPGLEVIASVANGADALKSLRDLEPDVAVLDINMPQLTGIEVLEAIETEGLSTRVVLLSASATDVQITRAVKKGAWGIMLKDTAADTLIECMEAVSKGERWLPTDLIERAFQRELERRTEHHA